jgi:hypothetical protein
VTPREPPCPHCGSTREPRRGGDVTYLQADERECAECFGQWWVRPDGTARRYERPGRGRSIVPEP